MGAKSQESVSVKEPKTIKWADIKAFVDVNPHDTICHIYTSATDAPDVYYIGCCGAVIHKSDKNYFVVSTGKVVDIK